MGVEKAEGKISTGYFVSSSPYLMGLSVVCPTDRALRTDKKALRVDLTDGGENVGCQAGEAQEVGRRFLHMNVPAGLFHRLEHEFDKRGYGHGQATGVCVRYWGEDGTDDRPGCSSPQRRAAHRVWLRPNKQPPFVFFNAREETKESWMESRMKAEGKQK